MDWLGKTRNPLTIYSSSGFPVPSRAVLGTFWRGCDARCCAVPALQRFRPSVPCGSGTPRPLSCFAGLGACMWSVSSLPSTRRDRAVTRKSKYLNFDRRHRMRRLRSKLRYFDFRVTARSRRVDGSDDTLHMQAPSPAKHESGRGVPLPHGTDGLNRCRAGTAQHLASQPRQKVPKTARLGTGKPLEL